ncbi:MAG: hypothetical protein JO246_04830 [Frankiaceae bacterium]|nr:hypothetical protein [Frankiaceae bacterium]MBV9870440.1 hypothetical protein [Frankiaceae bacterium]
MGQREIAGIGVTEIDRGGRRYAYPLDYPNLERIEASIQLSASHDDGEVEGLKVDPDSYAAQDAYFSTGKAQSPDFVKAMAEVIDPRFDALLSDVLADERKVDTLRRMGDHLATGGNIVNAVPHGPLLDIGLQHAMAFVGLSRLGYRFTIGIVISHGVAGRGKRFNDDLVCLADALDWACDRVWYVTPQTPKTRQSSYAEVVSAEHIQHRNAIVRADIAAAQDEGGILITVAPSATSIRTDSHGTHWLEAPTLGTMRLMSHPKTQVAIAVGRVLGAATPSYDLVPEFLTLDSDVDELSSQADELMARMVEGMRLADPGERYEIGRPPRA